MPGWEGPSPIATARPARHLARLYGWPLGVPLCRSLGGGLWEVRSSLSQGRIARVIFCVSAGRMVLLHAFIKKTQKTPQIDLETARGRQKDVDQ
ncbi:type II toxin-antitoxin system RelE/ParE family toxin [Methylobacterium sp. JK268]